MNLLPDSRKQTLARLYLMRLVVVCALLVSGVLCIHMLLAVPALAYTYQLVADRTIEAVVLGEKLSGTEVREVSGRIKTLNDTAVALSHSMSDGTATQAIGHITAVPHGGVRITGISFSKGATDTSSRMVLTGTAVSRESLRSYVSSLNSVPSVSSVDLPISAYAKESDIDFSITLTGRLSP